MFFFNKNNVSFDFKITRRWEQFLVIKKSQKIRFLTKTFSFDFKITRRWEYFVVIKHPFSFEFKITC